MIAEDIDQIEKGYFEIGMTGKIRRYHCLFFGPKPEHNWVSEGNLRRFNGLDEYNTYLDDLREKSKNGNKHVREMLKTIVVKPSAQAWWDSSIAEANEANLLDVEERAVKYVEVYMEKARAPMPTTPVISDYAEKKQRKSEGGASASTKANDEKGRRKTVGSKPIDRIRREAVSASTSSGSTPTMQAARPRRSDNVKREPFDASVNADDSNETTFKTFVRVHKDEVMGHFSYSYGDAKSWLSRQWSSFGSMDKVRYCNPHSSLSGFFDDESDEEESELVEKVTLAVKKLRPYAPSKFQPVCVVCLAVSGGGEDEVIVQCGDCQRFSHASCDRKKNNPPAVNGDAPLEEKVNHANGCNVAESDEGDGWKCANCTKGQRICICCGLSSDYGGEMVTCQVKACGQAYHYDCVKDRRNMKFNENALERCSRHIYQTCALDKNAHSTKATEGTMLQCVKCPTAYHIGDWCIAAGSQRLSNTFIVCSDHYAKSNAKVNVAWCFICGTGGSLICCEECPTSFHASCIDLTEEPDRYVCVECEEGSRPLYGDIMWVKVGAYRWWPCEVQHPDLIPDNIKRAKHVTPGEFPIKFYGAKEWYWLGRGRAFTYVESDSGTLTSKNKGLERSFLAAIDESRAAYKEYRKFREAWSANWQTVQKAKPPIWKSIRQNIPMEGVEIKRDLANVSKCTCLPNQEHPCLSDTKCMNRICRVECSPQVCDAGDRCENQRFMKRLCVATKPFYTGNKCGWGLKTLHDIKAGSFIGEYVGDLIDEAEMHRRIEYANSIGDKQLYFLTLDNKRIIDAGPKGNLTRFLNHSCNPNCRTEKWTVNGDIRVGIFAIRDMKANTELTFDYKFDCCGYEKAECHCGADQCVNVIDEKVKARSSAAAAPPAAKKIKRKKSVSKADRESEDVCFRCGDVGKLLVCDRKGCPKGYHLECLNIEKLPHGRWECPRHFCDECGGASISFCSYCPNSFCMTHATLENVRLHDGFVFCMDHEDDHLTAATNELREMGMSSTMASQQDEEN